MMEADAAVDDDLMHGPGAGYLWVVSPPTANNDDTPQRFWFEITTFCLQWRVSPRSEQHAANCLLLTDVTQVAPVGSTNLRVASLSSTLLLKAPTRDVRNMWLRSVGDAVFCSGRPPGATPADMLHECMSKGDTAYLRHILSTHASLAASVDDDGNSLLLQACKGGASVDVHYTLLQYGVDPSAVNLEDESPLVLVAASGAVDLIRLFVESGRVHVNQRCASGITAVLAAASTGQTLCLQLLVDYGGDVGTVDDRGWSALHYAAACPRGVHAVTWLCEMAPSLVHSPAHHDGHTPLHVAARFGYDDIVYVLLQFGASVECTNHDLDTPLHVAMAHRHAATTAMLQAMAFPSLVDGDNTQEHWGVPYYEEEQKSATTMDSQPNSVDETIAHAWVACTTEDGQAYFYNTVTFESVWELPEDASATLQHQDGVVSEDGHGHGPGGHGDEQLLLPICMVPTICPLYEMDNPDVHAKEMLRRKKERETRRSSRSKLIVPRSDKPK
ncbi:hypothetical protein H257_07699 [Aphanomyces astaci]|uniref:WW domain-containing protein n=1 Tax=Aphanomyces astaci TaxID=112090 RepID=W4GGT6_APHAT|nr:hypothetical protein H257_07699 [Aphanomyces astaci]ETV78897.1 hypothetical protein H257_07699 [Aphanomyces astaci]|eukprot:XP_009831616.1 hypothetical protein H257_07699 [Aphanomyces astaci]